jgi:transposase
MAHALLLDDLWTVIGPLLPSPPRPGAKGRRPPVEDRPALTGILFMLKSGLPWEMLPREMGCCSGMTRWRTEFGGLKLGQVKRLKELERENARLRKAILDLTLETIIAVAGR